MINFTLGIFYHNKILCQTKKKKKPGLNQEYEEYEKRFIEKS